MEWGSNKALGRGSIHSRVAPRSLSSCMTQTWREVERYEFSFGSSVIRKGKGLAYLSLPEIFHWITAKKVIHYIVSRNFRKLFVIGKQPGVWAFNKLQQEAL